MGREACLALSYAHGPIPGVVPDIKPGNLFLCDSGPVKVTDFGLAKAVRNQAERRREALRDIGLYGPGAVARGARGLRRRHLGSLAASCTSCCPEAAPLVPDAPGRLPRGGSRREPVAPLPIPCPRRWPKRSWQCWTPIPSAGRRPGPGRPVAVATPRQPCSTRGVTVNAGARAGVTGAPGDAANPPRDGTRGSAVARRSRADAAGAATPGRLSGAGAPVIPAQGPPEMSQAGVAAEGPGAGALVTGTRKRRRLLVPVIAGTAAAAAAIPGRCPP